MRTHEHDSPPFDEAAFAQLYSQHFPEFQMAWSVFLMRYTARLREAVGELDDALLLVALTIVSVLPGVAAPSTDGFDLRGGPYETGPAPPTNAVRLSDITGIPRETVRRRLVAMAARGWVEQSGPPRREWRLTVGPGGWPKVAQEFGAVHADFLRDVSRLLARWDRLARTAGWGGLTQPPRAGAGPAAPPGGRPLADR